MPGGERAELRRLSPDLSRELDQMPRQAQARPVCMTQAGVNPSSVTATVSTGQQPFQVKLIASQQGRHHFQEDLERADFKNVSVPILGRFSASRTRDGGPGESHLMEAPYEALVLKL